MVGATRGHHEAVHTVPAAVNSVSYFCHLRELREFTVCNKRIQLAYFSVHAVKSLCSTRTHARSQCQTTVTMRPCPCAAP